MALPHKTPLHVHKLHRLGNLVGRIEVKSHSLLNFCPPSPTSGWMQDELWRRQSSLQDFQELHTSSSECSVGGYRCASRCGAAPAQPASTAHTPRAAPHAHAGACSIPEHQNWAGIISQAPDPGVLHTQSLQGSGQPSELGFFSISTSTTSNIPWPYTTQRPTLIREARKERFLPLSSNPSLPVTAHFPAHLGNGNGSGQPGGQFRWKADSWVIFYVFPVFPFRLHRFKCV